MIDMGKRGTRARLTLTACTLPSALQPTSCYWGLPGLTTGKFSAGGPGE